ncbi:uncharacterized protein BCR38DRAFT_426524 [Pseudomassariella vexata]|uniref:Secreted protein n=1 Tax=Pseudomassariella vexata TaxID=1141098 RepID=A0A1Y2E7K9_9PEZI|nr:uncharacterized protein BCR38DRAFT_426524 [Pseudomassariella vexata]ORY67266.1 hypothetical protein BCR38DRAFT_426524 [Pseudomassariella vexata]
MWTSLSALGLQLVISASMAAALRLRCDTGAEAWFSTADDLMYGLCRDVTEYPSRWMMDEGSLILILKRNVYCHQVSSEVIKSCDIIVILESLDYCMIDPYQTFACDVLAI